MMITKKRQLQHRSGVRKQLIFCTLSALLSCGAAVAETNNQIKLTNEQILRAGIKTEAAIAADTAKSDGKASATEGQHLSGTVVAPPNAVSMISSMVSGVVQEVQHQSMQPIRSGNPIVSIFSQQLMEMQREYVQLATQSRLAKEKRERDEGLFNEGIIAQSRLQDSRAAAIQADVAARERYQALRSAGMGETQIRQLLSNQNLTSVLRISANSNGILTEINVKPGQRIEAGTPIASISKDGAFWVELQASAQQASSIRIGDLMQVNNCASAKVTAISSQIQSGNQTTLIRTQVIDGNQCLKLNQFVDARHQSGVIPPNSIGVPAKALIQSKNEHYVFVKNAQGFEAVKVKLLSTVGQHAWVSSNPKLQVGSQVATQGIIQLKGARAGLGAEEGGAQ
jgi:multidrug efflux pump subunit AcrA (membrane-fusion protein)